VVVTDSVAKQLDGLKKDPALSAAVRRFWSHGLDACGPAGDAFSALLHCGGVGQCWDVGKSHGRRSQEVFDLLMAACAANGVMQHHVMLTRSSSWLNLLPAT